MALPAPQALGPRHKPVSHARLFAAICAEVVTRGFMVARSQLALGAKGAALFGVLDLLPVNGATSTERALSFGFRNATDESMGIRAVAGSRVFVCDNLALSGDVFAISRKNTTGLDLGYAIACGFDKFLQHAATHELQIVRLQGIQLDDTRAKAIAYDVFAARIVPARLFDDVTEFYFRQTDDRPDCLPRTLWGLHNAFTRAMKDLTPLRSFGANTSLGRHFGDLVVDGEVVTP